MIKTWIVWFGYYYYYAAEITEVVLTADADVGVKEMNAENAAEETMAVDAAVWITDVETNATTRMTADAEQNFVQNLVLSKDPLYSIRTQDADVMNHRKS